MRENDTDANVLRDLALACTLLTRLPMPTLPDAAFDGQARAGWAFPLVGVLVGVLAGGAGWLSLVAGLPVAGAAGLALAVQIAVTGALHEDGLADTADGFWGGWDTERRLDIMRDSRIGVYGVVILILSLGLRWVALTALLPLGIGAIIAAGALSRAGLPALMTALPPARSDGASHRVGTPGWPISLLALAIGVIAALAATGAVVVLPALLAAVVCIGLGRIALAKIGGQTGDVLGAAQQLIEVIVLLGLAAAVA